MTATKLDSPRTIQRSRRGLWFLCFSVFLHLMVIGLLSRSNYSAPQIKRDDPKAIVAKLVFAQLPPIQEQESISAQIPESPQMQEKEAPETAPEVEKIQNETHPEIEQTKVAKPILEDTTSPVMPNVRRPLTSTGLTQRYMQQRNNEKLDMLVEQEVRHFRKQQQSPDLNIPEFDPYAEDQSVRKPQIVACDKTATKIFSMVGNMMGGNMRCREKPDIDEFINKRLEKR